MFVLIYIYIYAKFLEIANKRSFKEVERNIRSLFVFYRTKTTGQRSHQDILFIIHLCSTDDLLKHTSSTSSISNNTRGSSYSNTNKPTVAILLMDSYRLRVGPQGADGRKNPPNHWAKMVHPGRLPAGTYSHQP